jgi:hypothetical protein
MTLLLDTSLILVRDREDAVQAALNSAVLPTRVQLDGPNAEAGVRMEGWQLGAGTRLLHVRSNGFRLTRTSKHLRMAAPERISLAIQLRGCCSRCPHIGLLGSWSFRPTVPRGIRPKSKRVAANSSQTSICPNGSLLASAAPRLRAITSGASAVRAIRRVRAAWDGAAAVASPLQGPSAAPAA